MQPSVADFKLLTIEKTFAAAEEFGFLPTGRYLQLNSYENRVFQIFCEPKEDEPETSVIIKAYRPGRWSYDAITEEHQFLFDLEEHSFPGATPHLASNGSSLYDDGQFIYSASPQIKGRMPYELVGDDFVQLGRRLALLHNIGQKRDCYYRPELQVHWSFIDNLSSWVAPEVHSRYLNCAEELFYQAETALENQPFFRIHGDCHRGNILKTDPVKGNPQYFFVDFDDFVVGPPVQDFWMLLSESRIAENEDFSLLLKGYNQLRSLPEGSEALIPLLRALRIINYSHWISQRWSDPTFPPPFPTV